MAWANKVKSVTNNMGGKTETITGAASSYAYSSVIDFLKPKADTDDRYVTLWATASAVTGSDINISLWGALQSGGDKYLMVAEAVTAVTNAAPTQAAPINIEAYPAPYYYIGMLVDASEAANTVTLDITPGSI